MTHRSYKEESRKDWGLADPSGAMTVERIQLGAVLRIADATEKMAQRHTELIAQRDHYKERAESSDRYASMLERRVSALKGQITKLKKKGGSK